MNLKQRTTEQFEFDVAAPGQLRVEVKPDATTYVTLASPTGSLLLNEYKVKSGTSLDMEVVAEKAGKFSLRLKNSNLFATKTVSVKITSQ